MTYDFFVLGGGIVGLATAYQLSQRGPRLRIAVIEKGADVATHQSGRNSGVLHSGIYYRPGSLKATTCREGKRLMEALCREHELPFEICGKVIVATDASEIPRLETLFERGQKNGIACERIDAARLRELEPHVAGVAAIHVFETGIVDYRSVCSRLVAWLRDRGGEFFFQTEVRAASQEGDRVRVVTSRGELVSRFAINCCGLHSDRVARRSGWEPRGKIVPFRGEYYELVGDARRLCRNLIYPVPDPAFPFLGVHFTRMIGGAVECGPNAVPALAREGYRWRDINPRDLAEMLTYSGTYRLFGRHWRMGLGEIHRSLSRRAFAKQLQRLVPEIRGSDLIPAPAGVRAQVVHPSGDLADDFLLHRDRRILHVVNAPSPAATASLQIGNVIVDQWSDVLELRQG